MADFHSPRIIAIDAPLRLPLGLCCLEEDWPCQRELLRRYRQCDQELRQQGIPCYPTSKKTFVNDLIYRGIDLKVAIGRKLKQAGQVIEVHPFAGKVRLFGKTCPAKLPNKG